MAHSAQLRGHLPGWLRTHPAIVLLACGGLVLLGGLSLLLSAGKTVVVSTNAAGARVLIDGRTGDQLDSTTQVFTNVPFGERTVNAVHRDYHPGAQQLRVRLWTTREHEVRLEPKMIRLTLTTTPGAELYLEGELVGQADEQGVLEAAAIASGVYDAALRLAGHVEYTREWSLRDDEGEIQRTVHLEITDERREEAARLAQRGRELFAAREYQAALEAVVRSLALNPDDRAAQRLRAQIEETIRILG